MKGEKYVGYRRPANQKNTFQDIDRKSRVMGPSCSSSFCLKSKKRKCNEVSEHIWNALFRHFRSNLYWDRGAIFVCNMVVKDVPTERKAETDEGVQPRRTATLRYFIEIENIFCL